MKDFDLRLEQFESDWNVMNSDLNWQDFLIVDEADAMMPFQDYD